MISNPSIIDFQEINKKIKPETTEEVKFVKEVLTSVIDRVGLRGFFAGQVSPNPNGIALDYDVEEVKRELGGTT